MTTSSRPRTAGRAPIKATGVLRALATVLLLFGLAVAAPTAAIGAEPTSGYGSVPPTPEPPKPEPPKPEPPKPEPPKPEPPKPAQTKETTSPSGEVEKPELPEQGVAPISQKKAAAAPKTSNLPFTGFDLRWELGIGMLLIGAGCALMSAQRRRRAGRHS